MPDPNEAFARQFKQEQACEHNIHVCFHMASLHLGIALQEHLSRLKSTELSNSAQTEIQAQCVSSVSQLSSLLRDASSHLPAYDQRTYSTVRTFTSSGCKYAD